MSVTKEPFGKTQSREDVELFTLRNAAGAELKLMNYGGAVVTFRVPDRDGVLGDVVQGFESLGEYLEKSPYFGCIVGRWGNRIGNARFTLDGTVYELAANEKGNHLHGGSRGFDKRVWDARVADAAGAPLTTGGGTRGYLRWAYYF